jgi:hypothetical protein
MARGVRLYHRSVCCVMFALCHTSIPLKQTNTTGIKRWMLAGQKKGGISDRDISKETVSGGQRECCGIKGMPPAIAQGKHDDDGHRGE